MGLAPVDKFNFEMGDLDRIIGGGRKRPISKHIESARGGGGLK
jgi:hypothetical protein